MSRLCPAGFYCITPASTTACPGGTYSSARGLTSSEQCLQCPAGYTCPYTGPSTPTTMSPFPYPALVAIQCAIGYYCPAGSSSFTPCPAGFYCPSPMQKIQCPGGYVCPVGTINYQTPTPMVDVPSNGVESCRVICARGSYATTANGLRSSWGGAICVDVPGGSYTCESIPRTPMTCRCQRAIGFGWIP
jgi:hypothetical protein